MKKKEEKSTKEKSGILGIFKRKNSNKKNLKSPKPPNSKEKSGFLGIFKRKNSNKKNPKPPNSKYFYLF